MLNSNPSSEFRYEVDCYVEIRSPFCHQEGREIAINYYPSILHFLKNLGIVPLVATPSRGDLRIFKMAFVGYFRLGYIGLGDSNCPAGLGNWPRRVRPPRRG